MAFGFVCVDFWKEKKKTVKDEHSYKCSSFFEFFEF